MRTKFTFPAILVILVLCSNILTAQGVSINEDGSEPEATAILDIKSSDKGLLIPRMTSEAIRAIPHPANGLQVYNIEDGKLYIYVEPDDLWKEVSYGSGSMKPFFICGEQLVDDRDDQSYNTVDINGKCWMAENLNYGNFVYSGTNQYDNETVEKYCLYNNTSYCDNLGGLYQWNEMMDYSTLESSQGICPDGWHIPSDQEWFEMENFLDPAIYNINQMGWRGSNCGMKLKNTGVAPPYNWPYPNYGTNESGFTALPGGIRTTSGSTTANPTSATFWTSTQSGGYAYERELYYGYNTSYRNAVNKYFGMSIRCIKDQE